MATIFLKDKSIKRVLKFAIASLLERLHNAVSVFALADNCVVTDDPIT